MTTDMAPDLAASPKKGQTYAAPQLLRLETRATALLGGTGADGLSSES